MSRLILVMQFPIKLRYQEFWWEEFPKEFLKYYDEVIVLGNQLVHFFMGDHMVEDKSMFSSIKISTLLEIEQIREYLELDLKDSDTLFSCDLSFPGFFSNVLYHKKPKKIFSFCHATSLNAYDYFWKVRKSKWLVETGNSKLFNKIFVGSNYHKQKLGWSNVIVTGVPKPPFQTLKEEKIYDIISVSRPSIQKVNKKFEKKIERDFGKIIRKECGSWKEYYKFLSSGKVILFTGKEDTFGYSILEAAMNNSIPIAPNKFAYPELLGREFLYNDLDEAIAAIWNGIHFSDQLPEIQCMDLVNNFYENIAKEMLNV